jgi:hypothetical protein
MQNGIRNSYYFKILLWLFRGKISYDKIRLALAYIEKEKNQLNAMITSFPYFMKTLKY